MARFIYKRLAKYPGYWRVDGIGQIRPGTRLGNRLTVHFSGISENGIAQPYWKQSTNGIYLPPISIHPASLKHFKVGSVWQDGKRVLVAPPEQQAFSINANKARFVKLNQSIELNGIQINTVLPETNFFLGENLASMSKTWFCIVPVVNNVQAKWLVIPASEILCFYYGVSSRLLGAVIQGRTDTYVDWSKSSVEKGVPTLHAKQRLSRKESAVLARALTSPEAKNSLFGVHQYLSKTAANNTILNTDVRQPLTIKCSFPFSDFTQIYASGKLFPIINTGKKKEFAYFAMEINSCSHSFGFQDLVIESDEARGSGTTETQNGSHGPIWSPQLDDEEDKYEVDDVPADQRLKRLIVKTYTNQFSALHRIQFEHRYPLGENSSHVGPRIDLPIQNLTMNDGTYAEDGKGNLGILESQHQVEKIERELELFLEVLTHLRTQTAKRKWVITTRSRNQRLTRNGEQIELFPEKIKGLRSWHLIEQPNGDTRPRQVIWTEIKNQIGDFFYLLEMELKSTENGQCTILLFQKNFSRLSDDDFRELLALTAIRNRWPEKDKTWKEMSHHNRAKKFFENNQIFRIHHPKTRTKKNNNKVPVSSKIWSSLILDHIDDEIGPRLHTK